jgi:hypothetical protein
VALSFFICREALEIGVGRLGKPGSGFLAFGAGAVIGLLALAVLIRSFMSRPEPVKADQDSGSVRRGRFLAICVSLFVYAILVKWLGFALPTFLFVFFLFQTVESERWWRSLAKALLITAGAYLLFVVWLGVNLPGDLWTWSP